MHTLRATQLNWLLGMVSKQVDVKGTEVVNLVSITHLVRVTHLVCVTHLCMTTPWRRQVKQQVRCVWTLVMTWAAMRLVHCHTWHTMMRVHLIRLPMGTHLSPHPWFAMIPAYPHPLLHLHCPPPIRLPY